MCLRIPAFMECLLSRAFSIVIVYRRIRCVSSPDKMPVKCLKGTGRPSKTMNTHRTAGSFRTGLYGRRIRMLQKAGILRRAMKEKWRRSATPPPQNRLSQKSLKRVRCVELGLDLAGFAWLDIRPHEHTIVAQARTDHRIHIRHRVDHDLQERRPFSRQPFL